jgi:hypothetical protein
MNWDRWHREYDSPTSSLSRRLEVVQRDLRRALASPGVRRLTTLCAGEGRDVLPVLAEHPDVTALLVELDPTLSDRARATAAALGLSRVEVRIADAGATDTYLHVPPADVLTACGVFGNISTADVRRTIATLPSLLSPAGVVIWTRGRTDDGGDPSVEVRGCFARNGFTELSFTSPTDARFRVGVHQRTPGATAPPLRPGGRLFTFIQ